MKIIGIIGGVASGKSLVACALHNLGAAVVDVDAIGHEVLELPEIQDQMTMRWGDKFRRLASYSYETLPTPSFAFRAHVGKIVFNNLRELDFLEAILWPEMSRRIERTKELYNPSYTDWSKEGKQFYHSYTKALVLDFPMLLETGQRYNTRTHTDPSTIFDTLWFVDCPLEQRQKNFYQRRLAQFPDMDEEASKKRHAACEARQLSVEHKKSRILNSWPNKGVIIQNDMVKENVERQVKESWNSTILTP